MLSVLLNACVSCVCSDGDWFLWMEDETYFFGFILYVLHALNMILYIDNIHFFKVIEIIIWYWLNIELINHGSLKQEN